MKSGLLSARTITWSCWATMLWLVLVSTGCNRSDQDNPAPSEAVSTNVDRSTPEQIKTAITNPGVDSPVASTPPSQPVSSRVVSNAKVGSSSINLPDFTTYLVSVPSSGSISIEAISDLSSLCAQLKQQVSIPEINAIMECYLRSDEPLSTNVSPANTLVSFTLQNSGLRGENLPGLAFSFEGWNSLKPAQGDIAVLDFNSPKNKFGRFRVVTFPPGTAIPPIKFSKSVLRANQSGLLASFENFFASRIVQLKSAGGFLQLRPLLRTENGPVDLIEALPPPYKTVTENGNELNFTRLREAITRAIAEIEYQSREQEAEGSASIFVSARERLYLQQKSAGLESSLAANRKCLALVPKDLADVKLDHVSLFFVAGSQTRPQERVELIRFEDAFETLEGVK